MDPLSDSRMTQIAQMSRIRVFSQAQYTSDTHSETPAVDPRLITEFEVPPTEPGETEPLCLVSYQGVTDE